MLNRATRTLGTSLGRWVVLFCGLGCSPKPIPDPRLAAQSWAAAMQKGDAKAAFQLLRADDQRNYGLKGVEQLMAEHRDELVTASQATASGHARVEASANIEFGDDRSARLVLERGRFRVAAAGAFPTAAATPLDALRDLREVLSRRSFAGLLRVLTRDKAQTLEASLDDLLEALKEPSSLELELEGRRAVAKLPGGHKIELEREDGLWRVKEFD